MRTTIDIPDEQYVALRTLAAARGLRGFSPLVSDAIGQFLAGEGKVDEALALAGVLSAGEADALEATVKEQRAASARSVTPEEHGRP